MKSSIIKPYVFSTVHLVERKTTYIHDSIFGSISSILHAAERKAKKSEEMIFPGEIPSFKPPVFLVLL